MKPPGLDHMFQVVKHSAAEDKIWEAVELAIQEGMSPQTALIEFANSWAEYIDDRAREDKKEMRRLIDKIC